MTKRRRLPNRGEKASKTSGKNRLRALVRRRPWIQAKLGKTSEDSKSAQVSFQRDHEAISRMPTWYQRMEAEKRTGKEVVREEESSLRSTCVRMLHALGFPRHFAPAATAG